MEATGSTETPVVVTTRYRGVFFGHAEATSGEVISLRDARMAVYWSTDLKGVLGLASHGPDSHCRISDSVGRMEIRDVTAVIECEPEAVKKWEAGPWG